MLIRQKGKAAINGEPLTARQRRLEAQLLERLRHDIEECRSIGFSPNPFVGMIARRQAAGACIRVVTARKPPDGFLRLLELQRLDLTAERAILDGPWRLLFSEQILEAAKRRLHQYDRTSYRLS